MKYFLAIIICFGCSFIFGSDFTPPPFTNKEEAETAIPRVLEQIPDLIASDPSGVEAQEFLRTHRLPQWIAFYFQNGIGPIRSPSSERDDRVAEIEEILAPYEQELLELVFLTKEKYSTAGIALQYLNYLPATETLASSLFKLSKEIDDNESLVGKVHKMIYTHQFDDNSFREGVIDFILENRDQRTREGRFASVMSGAAMRSAISEMKEVYLNDLSISVNPDNYIRGSRSLLASRICGAATGMKYFGLLGGEEAVDLIKKRLTEFDPKNESDKPAIQSLEEALEIVSGNRRPEVAFSWKGRLLGVSEQALDLWKKKNESTVEEVAEVIEEVITPEAAIEEEPAEVIVIEPIEKDVEQSSSWWLWLIGALVIVGVLGLVLRKKS